MWQVLTEPPEESAGEADGKEQPDLVKDLLGSRQETSLQQLLEKFLAAEGGHRSPSRMDGQMDRPVKVGTQSTEQGCPRGRLCSRHRLEYSDFSLGLSNPFRHTVLAGVGGWGWGSGRGCGCQVHQIEPPAVRVGESWVHTHSPRSGVNEGPVSLLCCEESGSDGE